MTPVLLDFESRSRADLPTVGGRRYWEHPTSEALCAVWYDTADGSVGVWAPGQQWPHEGRVLAAHNAFGFDRFAAEKYDFRAAAWIDTAQLARKAGLPGALDALGTRWLGLPKDKEASKYTKALSSVRRPKGITAAAWRGLSDEDKRRYGEQPSLDQAGFERVVRYCARDVEIMAHAWPRLAQWLPVDRQVEELDQVINDRGVAFDSALAQRLLAEDERLTSEAVQAAAAELGMTEADCRAAAGSWQQFCTIVGCPNAQAATIEGIDHPLVRARQALASIARGKLLAGLARMHADGRLRDTLLYYGAHTGRWSGRGMQVQNMPRPTKEIEELDIDAVVGAVLAGRACTQDEVSAFVRATLTASPEHVLVTSDLSSIEARATAWAGGDTKALRVYASDLDPYKVTAAAIYGVQYSEISGQQRQVGKVAELACGYQGGPGAFERFAKVYRLDLSTLDVPAIVKSWRVLHSPIVQLWSACASAFRRAARGTSSFAGPFEFVPSDDGKAVACFLPSGRPIVYHDVQISDGGALSYLGRKGEEHIYGGKLVENAIQGLCRDIMAEAMIAAEDAGLRPVMTIHDEIVCDVPREKAEKATETLSKIMTRVPAWAAGMPIGAKGWTGFRYKKG